MEENIQQLFKTLNRCAVEYMTDWERDNIKIVKENIPQIQQFATWFMQEDRRGFGPEPYQGMCENLLQVLRDIVSALSQDDHVLLHDAVTYGVLEYLKLFVVQEKREDDSL